MTIQDDYNTLNTIKSDNQDLLSKLYRDLETPDLSPSRKLNIYIKNPYAFPSIIYINNLDTFSDTLFKQRKQINPQILKEKNIILNNNRTTTKRFFLK